MNERFHQTMLERLSTAESLKHANFRLCVEFTEFVLLYLNSEKEKSQWTLIHVTYHFILVLE